GHAHRCCVRQPRRQAPPHLARGVLLMRRRALAGSTIAALLLLTAGASAPRFYPDDPIWVDDDKAMDASQVVPIEDSNVYDFVVNTLGKPGDRRNIRALNVNTLDEVPDSSWFVNRIGRRE